MSLINQMLNDLDSRHAEAGEQRVPNEVRPLPVARRATRWQGPVAVLAVLLLGLGVWAWLRGVAPPPVAAPAVPAAPASPAAAAPVAAVPLPAAVPGLPPLAAPDPAVAAAPTVAAAPPRVAPPAAETRRDAAPARSAEPALRLAQSVGVPAAADVAPATPLPIAAAATAPTAETVGIAKQQRTPTPRERSDAHYRSALGKLNQGRVDDAVATLRAVLHEDPGHHPSRQLLLRILLDARAYDELRGVLEAGLEQAPQQTPWALLLSRLLADRGDNEAALKVLQAPALETGPELRGACAAMLQRLGRHAEAEVQYAEALRLDSRDGRWWVGYGIAAEAQGKPAREIYQRAREVGGLSADLQAFVEQKLR